MEKYGTFEYWECAGCGHIHHRSIGEPLPTCECVREKLAASQHVVTPAWVHRFDLENKEAEDHGGHA